MDTVASRSASPASPSHAGVRAVVERFYDGALQGDLAAVNELLDDDVVIIEAASLPWGGSHRGRHDAAQLLALLFDGIDLDTAGVVALLCDDDRAAAILEVPFPRGDGTFESMSVVETFVVRNGKIVEIKPFYFDTAAIIAGSPPQ